MENELEKKVKNPWKKAPALNQCRIKTRGHRGFGDL